MQFLESSSTPLQSLPPLRGAGAAHSRLRQWVHSVLHADHLLHSVHAPSTAGHQTQVCRYTPQHGLGARPPAPVPARLRHQKGARAHLGASRDLWGAFSQQTQPCWVSADVSSSFRSWQTERCFGLVS